MASLYSEKNLSDVMQELKALPFNPRPLGGRMSTLLGFIPDALPMLLDTKKKSACWLYPYPRSFKSITFPSLDGTTLAGKLALHDDRRARPGLVFCHGIFGSKNQNYIRSVALKAFRDWDYNVLALDTRGFGESQRLSDAQMTGCWKESEDIIGAAKTLGSYPEVTTVGVCGYSLGAGAAMIAASKDGGEFITGGVMAWNGLADQKRMIEYIDKFPMPWQPFYFNYPVFKACLILKLREAGGGYAHLHRFKEAFAHTCSNEYCLPEEEVLRFGSPKNYVAEIKIPTVHVHAEDDPVIPVREAEENRAVARDNPDFDVWILKRGGHIMFPMVDKVWYHQVLQGFFGAWALRESSDYSHVPLERTGIL